MSANPTCSCSVKELINHQLTGTPHTDCQPEQNTITTASEPPALNSDALVNSITAALGTNTTTSTTL